METIAQAKTWPQWQSRAFSLRLPQCMVVVFMMLTCFTMLNVGTLALAGYATPFRNPFASFADIVPGQPRSAVVAQGFSCAMGTYPILPNEYCTFSPAGGIFDRIGVVISNGIVSQTDFTVRENALMLGDLVGLWGTPAVAYAHGRHVTDFFWSDGGVSASAFSATGQFSLFLPVWSVAFSEAPLPG